MAHIDVFNGDADGICSLIQLRRHDPVASELVTGVKRDLSLLKRVNASVGDTVTVLDIAVEKKPAGLGSLAGCRSDGRLYRSSRPWRITKGR